MREILFRGKRVDNDEWVCGSFCMDTLEQFNGLCGVDGFIRLYDKDKGKMQMYEVDRETVGQFTGLTDKNGKRIFEGDIIFYAQLDGSRAYGLVKFCEHGCGGTFNVGFSVDWFGRYDTGWLRNDIGFWAKFREIEVIGNIHDNPELLGGTDDERKAD